MYETNKKVRLSIIGLISITILYSSYILLPLEAGFPRLEIFGFEVESSITFSVIAFLMTCYAIKKDILYVKIDNYIIFQSLFVFVLIFGSLMSEFPLSSLREAVTYFFSWLINYIIIKKYIDMGYTKYIILIICGAVFFSTVEAILEGLGFVIPLYADWHINYKYQWDDNFKRVLGTVGNPLVLGVTYVLALPFALSIKNVYLRFILILLIVIGAFLTVSKTVIILGTISLVGYFVVIGRKHVIKLAIFAVLFLTIFISTNYSGKLLENPHVQLWSIRLSMGTDSGAMVDKGISMRKLAIIASFNKIVNGDIDKMLIGYGNQSHISISETIEPDYRTLDNMFLEVLHNNGTIGLLVFLVAFLYPAMNRRSLGHRSLYWYNALCFMSAGLSFVCYPYSGVNILMVTSYILMNKKV